VFPISSVWIFLPIIAWWWRQQASLKRLYFTVLILSFSIFGVPHDFMDFIDNIVTDTAFLVCIISLDLRAGSSTKFKLWSRNGMLLLEKRRSSLVSLVSNSITSPLKSLSGRLGKLWDLRFQSKFTLNTIVCHRVFLRTITCKHVFCLCSRKSEPRDNI
jgi:hypothetical protein